jgi:hypothetical protein
MEPPEEVEVPSTKVRLAAARQAETKAEQEVTRHKSHLANAKVSFDVALATLHTRFATLQEKEVTLAGVVAAWGAAGQTFANLSVESANDTTSWSTEATASCRASYRGVVEEHGEAKQPVDVSEGAADEVLESDDEPDEAEVVSAVIEVETVASWKKAYSDWVWSADPAEAHPEKLLGWLNVWKGTEGDEIAATLRKTADEARLGLAGKRDEFREANNVVIITRQAGAVGESMAMQQQLEAHGSHCRASFPAWMEMELNEKLGSLLSRREADLAGGTADGPKDAVVYTVANETGFVTAKGSKRSASSKAALTAPGFGAKGGGKGVAKDIAEKKEVLKFATKGAGAPIAKKA